MAVRILFYLTGFLLAGPLVCGGILICAGGGWLGIWALDPIDGTKGFLRGDQYAVCLALMVDGKVQAGALGCPNLPVDPANPDGEKGIMLSVERGRGATIVCSMSSLYHTRHLMALFRDLSPPLSVPEHRSK